jgi:hypothetical protein
MTKGRDGTLASSTCNRESHFWQTIIMASYKEVEDLKSEVNYSIILNIDPGSETAASGTPLLSRLK